MTTNINPIRRHEQRLVTASQAHDWKALYNLAADRATVGSDVLPWHQLPLAPQQRFKMPANTQISRVTACAFRIPRSVIRRHFLELRLAAIRYYSTCRRSSTAHELAHRLTVKRRPRISANALAIAQRKLATPQSPFQNNSKHAFDAACLRITGLPPREAQGRIVSSRLALPVSPAQDLSHHGHRSRHPPAHRLREFRF